MTVKRLSVAALGALGALVLGGCGGCPDSPWLEGISPGSGAVHTPVTITGVRFGDFQGGSVVTFRGVPATVLSWSDTRITVRVPVIPTPEGSSTPCDVVVAIEGRGPSSLRFTVVRGILFASDRDDGDYDIYVMNPDGSGQTRLTHDPADDSWPSWSPCGTRVAFTSDRDGNGEIYVMSADGSGQTRLTHHPGEDESPGWSPDGAWIVFSRELGINSDLFVADADGSGEVRLTDTLHLFEREPTWSPDGTRIALTVSAYRVIPQPLPPFFVTAVVSRIGVILADGSGLNYLTEDDRFGSSPSWSPDGTRLVFVDKEAFGTGDTYIAVVNADGSGLTRLTPPDEACAMPSWSPCGRKIAFSFARDVLGPEEWDIYVMNADGSGRTQLTNHPASDVWPAWRD